MTQGKRSISCCINVEIAKIKSKEKPLQLTKKPYKQGSFILDLGTNHIILRNGKKGGKIKDDYVSEWLTQVDHDDIKVYGLKKDKQLYFLMSAPIEQATGLATNITKWLVIDADKKRGYGFNSLSENANLFYLKDNTLRSTIFDYSEDFINNKDYDNMTWEVNYYQIVGGEKKLVKSFVSKCECY
ncbi:hypothetical protein D3C80_1313530 [compost metagenome]